MRGHAKVSCHLIFDVLALAIAQLMVIHDPAGTAATIKSYTAAKTPEV